MCLFPLFKCYSVIAFIVIIAFLQLVVYCGMVARYRPAYSIPRILAKAGLTLKDIDAFELHEAFAVSPNFFD